VSDILIFDDTLPELGSLIIPQGSYLFVDIGSELKFDSSLAAVLTVSTEGPESFDEAEWFVPSPDPSDDDTETPSSADEWTSIASPFVRDDDGQTVDNSEYWVGISW
jgi:hypothetical protein